MADGIVIYPVVGEVDFNQSRKNHKFEGKHFIDANTGRKLKLPQKMQIHDNLVVVGQETKVYLNKASKTQWSLWGGRLNPKSEWVFRVNKPLFERIKSLGYWLDDESLSPHVGVPLKKLPIRHEDLITIIWRAEKLELKNTGTGRMKYVYVHHKAIEEEEDPELLKIFECLNSDPEEEEDDEIEWQEDDANA